MKHLAIFLCLASALFANVGKIVTLRGDVVITHNNQERKAKANDILEENDTITTKNNAKLQIKFVDNTIITLGKNTTLNIKDYVIDGKNSKVNLKVDNGHFKVMSGNISKIARENFAFQAKTATIGIRGTVFVGSLGKVDKVGCLEGAIDVKVGDKSQLINAGKQLRFDNDKIVKIEKIAPKDFETINPLDKRSGDKPNYSSDDSFNDFLNSKVENIKNIQESHKNSNYKHMNKFKRENMARNKNNYDASTVNNLDNNTLSNVMENINKICNGNSQCADAKLKCYNSGNCGYLNRK